MASTKPKKKNPRLASGRKRVRQDTKLNAANTSLRSKYRRQGHLPQEQGCPRQEPSVCQGESLGPGRLTFQANSPGGPAARRL
jgi:hypothetical protein